MGFAIPITDIRELVTSLMNGEEDKSGGMIGIEGYFISEQQSTQYNMPTGVYISKIVDGSGADKAGLEIGNIIVEIDNIKVTKFADITDYLYNKKKGEKVKLKINYINGRQYSEKTVEVTLS
jgi:serine protease Do